MSVTRHLFYPTSNFSSYYHTGKFNIDRCHIDNHRAQQSTLTGSSAELLFHFELRNQVLLQTMDLSFSPGGLIWHILNYGTVVLISDGLYLTIRRNSGSLIVSASSSSRIWITEYDSLGEAVLSTPIQLRWQNFLMVNGTLDWSDVLLDSESNKIQYIIWSRVSAMNTKLYTETATYWECSHLGADFFSGPLSYFLRGITRMVSLTDWLN